MFIRSSAPVAAVGFISREAPKASRIFNWFDDGPWLLWFGRSDVKHYLDPRNNLGAGVLSRYSNQILPRPLSFDAEARRLAINLVLIPCEVGLTSQLLTHLSQSSEWGLVYWDGWFAVFASRTRQNAPLLQRRQYRVLRPTFTKDFKRFKDIELENWTKRGP